MGLEPAASAVTAVREMVLQHLTSTRGLPGSASHTRLQELWVELWVLQECHSPRIVKTDEDQLLRPACDRSLLAWPRAVTKM